MKIGHLQKTSLIEYPGRISAIVFTRGCNFLCPYCHNPELVDPARFVDELQTDDVFSFLEKRKDKLDAVVITGGEPTVHSDLIDFIKRIKDLGYLVKLDTNGSNPSFLQRIIKECTLDYIAMDIKAPLDNERYCQVVGKPVDIERIESSIFMIMESAIPYEFRTTLIRSLLEPEDILEIGHTIKGASLYVLQRFVASKHIDEQFIRQSSFSEEEIASIISKLNGLVNRCMVR